MNGSTISCKCGLTCFRFASTRARFTLECTCVDCKQKLAWISSKSDPIEVADVQTLTYLDNCITNVVGRNNLRHYKLRENGRSPFVVAACCHSILAVDNPRYSGNVVMILTEACVVTTEPVAAVARIFLNDWVAAGRNIDSLPPFQGPSENCFYCDHRDDEIHRKEVFSAADTDSPVRVEWKELGKPLKTILSELGIDVPIVLGLEEGCSVSTDNELRCE